MNLESNESEDEHELREMTYKIRGAVFEVYRQMGCGFLEAVYQECLEREFVQFGIPCEAQKNSEFCPQKTQKAQKSERKDP